jgi:hypothetical protein
MVLLAPAMSVIIQMLKYSATSKSDFLSTQQIKNDPDPPMSNGRTTTT